MNYNRKKCWGAVVIVFIAAVLAAGYAIGDYFVDYALKRGNETDPLAPPAACVNILDKSREMPEEPAVPTEEWRMTMPDGRNKSKNYTSPWLSTRTLPCSRFPAFSSLPY